MVDYTVAGVDGGACAPRGFRAAGVDAGLVPGPGPDLALIASQQPAVAVGRLTTHHFASAPVRWTRGCLDGGRARAVLAHSGAANAATGPGGDADAAALAAAAAKALDCGRSEVLLLGTGPIGVRLDLAAATDAVGPVVSGLSRRGSAEVGRALTAMGGAVREQAVAVAWSEGEVRIGAVAKASAPFAPAFATTLVMLTTDAHAAPATLSATLRRAVARSFERVLVDQGPGIGDAVVLLANGTAAAPALTEGSEGAAAFESALGQLCESLAEGLAMRIPGTRKLLVVTVHGAATHADALAAARAVSASIALRAALAAGIAAWPAALDALGLVAVDFDPGRVGIRFGPVTVVSGGRLAPHDEGAAAAVAAKSQVDIAVDLGTGSAAATITTTDLPPEAIERLAVTAAPPSLAAPVATPAPAPRELVAPAVEDVPPDPPEPGPDLTRLEARPAGGPGSGPGPEPGQTG
jgi:glutamate N-acetyltransferase/amino-acid N-acetyltransferase